MEQTLPAAIVSSGDKIGRYNVLGKLATGGMAEVFLARQDGPMGFSKNVVLKRILPQYATDEEFLHMFLNEARLAAMINHPNVVSIFELGEDPQSQSLFQAMEYIDGRNLKDVLKRAVTKGSQLPIRLSARLVADACAGLEFAHDLKDQDGKPLNLVHRDISADNILVSYSGLVKVVDFGIAKAALSENRTKTGQVKGKFGYMAPEMLLGHQIDRRVDVWALGIVLYWLLAGRRPFRGENEGMLVNQVVNGAVPPIERAGPPVPKELEDIVRKALEKDPAKRYQTAGQLRTDLELWLSQSGEPVTTASVAEVMEKLFPADADKERLAMAKLIRGESRPSGWSNPGILSRTNSDPSSVRAPPSTTGGSDSVPVSQVLAKPTVPARPRRWLAAGLATGALLAIGGTYAVLRPRDLPPPPELKPEPLAELKPLPAPEPPKPDPTPAPKPEPVAIAKDPRHSRTPKPPKGSHTPAPIAHADPAPAPTPAPTPAPEPTPAPVNAGPPGKLMVDVRPWATVFVDGSRVGMTPIDPMTLSPGKHKVELNNDEIGAHVTETIEIKSGETTHLRKKLGGE